MSQSTNPSPDDANKETISFLTKYFKSKEGETDNKEKLLDPRYVFMLYNSGINCHCPISDNCDGRCIFSPKCGSRRCDIICRCKDEKNKDLEPIYYPDGTLLATGKICDCSLPNCDGRFLLIKCVSQKCGEDCYCYKDFL